MDRAEFAKRFSKALVARGWSQPDAARACGVAQPRIWEYASGKRLPPIDTVHTLIVKLDLDPRILFPEWVDLAWANEAADHRLAKIEAAERPAPAQEALVPV